MEKIDFFPFRIWFCRSFLRCWHHASKMLLHHLPSPPCRPFVLRGACGQETGLQVPPLPHLPLPPPRRRHIRLQHRLLRIRFLVSRKYYIVMPISYNIFSLLQDMGAGVCGRVLPKVLRALSVHLRVYLPDLHACGDGPLPHGLQLLLFPGMLPHLHTDVRDFFVIKDSCPDENSIYPRLQMRNKQKKRLIPRNSLKSSRSRGGGSTSTASPGDIVTSESEVSEPGRGRTGSRASNVGGMVQLACS